MAPKALSYSLSLSPLSLNHNFTNSTRNLVNNYTKPTTLILCKSSQTSQPHHLSVSGSEPDGTGSSAPTRGDLYLQYQQSVTASKLVLQENKKQRKKNREALKAASIAVTCCYGCGAPLQTLESDAPGFVDPDTYELKKKHHQLRTVLCGRCKLLSHGYMITAVGGNGGYSGGKQFVTAEELREKLSHLRYEKALIVKLVDVVDFNGSFLAHVRDLAGANPIILVVTKVDLLPKGTDLNCVGDWVVEATMKKKLNVLSVHLTSSKSLVGISGVAYEIQKEKKGRNVYILVSKFLDWRYGIDDLIKKRYGIDDIQIILTNGSANVGKSAFISALLKRMAQKDPVAAAAQKYKPIQSAVPGTTLGPIQIEAFLGGGKLFDTPGVHLHHRQAAVVHSEDLPALAPQSRLRGQSFPNHLATYDKGTERKIQTNGLNGFSIFWGGLVRIDILKVLPQTCLTFYGPKALQIHLVPTDEADKFYQKELGNLLTPPTGKQRNEWMGLETERRLQIKFEDIERPTCDVAISGLGWIAVEPISKSLEMADGNLEEIPRELHLAIHVPKPVEIFVRPPLPVSKAGGEWYQYRELTEKEQEVRPKWYL